MANPIGLLRIILLLNSKRRNKLIARGEECLGHVLMLNVSEAIAKPRRRKALEMKKRQKRLFLPITLLCLGGLNTASAQCLPHCSMDDSCIVVVKPAANDTIVENDVLAIEFVVGIDLATAGISIDSGKSWTSLVFRAITVTPCTTRTSGIQAPLLDDIGVEADTKIQACKIQIAAYGTSRPSGISNGYFFIKRRNSSVRFDNRKLRSKLSLYAENKLYNILGQAVDSKTLHRGGVYLVVNKAGKVTVLNRTCNVSKKTLDLTVSN
jgi:hypothetical protein